jgi:hypothetical protein
VSADVRQVGSLAEALAAYDDRFLRWQVTSAGFQAAWVGQRAVVIHRLRGTQPQLIVLGHGPQVTEPLELAAAVLPSQQLADGSVRLTIESRAAPYLPASLRLAAEKTDAWEWMWTRAEPPPVPGEEAVRWTDDMDPVLTLLAHANPRHHGRPGDPDIRGWAGVYEAGSSCVPVHSPTSTPAPRTCARSPRHRSRAGGAWGLRSAHSSPGRRCGHIPQLSRWASTQTMQRPAGSTPGWVSSRRTRCSADRSSGTTDWLK